MECSSDRIVHHAKKIEDCDFSNEHFDIVVSDMNVAVKDLLSLTINRLTNIPKALVLTCKRVKVSFKCCKVHLLIFRFSHKEVRRRSRKP